MAEAAAATRDQLEEGTFLDQLDSRQAVGQLIRGKAEPNQLLNCSVPWVLYTGQVVMRISTFMAVRVPIMTYTHP